MTIIIDGRKLRDEILTEVKSGVEELSFTPVFCDLLVGEDPSSAQYVRMKARTAESVGIEFHNANFPVSITTEELIEEINKLNKFPHMCGIIIQLPLPAHIDRRAVLDAIDPSLDVDCLGTEMSKEFYTNYREGILSLPTALACMEVLHSINLDLSNKKILILGQGELVGRPVTALLRSQGLHPDIVDRKTDEHIKKSLIKNADVIISGMGYGEHITGEMIKQGVVIVDAGTSESEGAIVGDVDLESVKGIASFVSPVPGGVGPVTVACLLKNVLTVANKLK